MPQYKIMIAQFPGGFSTHPDVSDWVTETVVKMREDPRIGPGNIKTWRRSDTPITMGRNQACLVAEQCGMDYLVMIDSDMCPDLPYPEAKPFWESSFEFALQHDGPCLIAAPYCGPPPNEMVYVFYHENQQSEHPNPDFQITAYSRAEASRLRGILRAAALPTGLILIDVRALRKLPHPRFYYEWKNDGPRCTVCGNRHGGPQVEKASTEDVAFSRDCHTAGIPLYCNWDAWAGHYKLKLVGRPQEVPDDAVPKLLWERARQSSASQESGFNRKPASQESGVRSQKTLTDPTSPSSDS
jgi:hypothetical protein